LLGLNGKFVNIFNGAVIREVWIMLGYFMAG
jgi:hypothetical protein